MVVGVEEDDGGGGDEWGDEQACSGVEAEEVGCHYFSSFFCAMGRVFVKLCKLVILVDFVQALCCCF